MKYGTWYIGEQDTRLKTYINQSTEFKIFVVQCVFCTTVKHCHSFSCQFWQPSSYPFALNISMKPTDNSKKWIQWSNFHILVPCIITFSRFVSTLSTNYSCSKFWRWKWWKHEQNISLLSVWLLIPVFFVQGGHVTLPVLHKNSLQV